MSNVMQGVRVVELAGWTFVPSAGAVLADWGAEVIKIEHPETGDPQRGLNVGALGTAGPGGVSFMMEQPNRGKKSVGLDVASEAGRDLLLRLIAGADVFLTNLLPGSLERLRLSVEDVRAVNPSLVYARGTGYGVRGPEANSGGFDSAVYWSRAGIAAMLQGPDAEFPPFQRPAFGDIMGGLTLAGGISAALFKRERTGEGSVLDVSLMGLGVWNVAPDITATALMGEEKLTRFSVKDMPNPLMNYYQTSDGRWLQLMMLQADRFWPDVAAIVERSDFLDDPRFATAGARFQNRVECIEELRKAFAARPLAEWRERLTMTKGVWAVLQTPAEVLADQQVVANGYVRPVTTDEGFEYSLVANPVQFDETPPDLVRAPDHGQHTDEVLLDLGLDYDEIIELKTSSVIL
ncbi:CaiB/BaiF CoA-transferase family protein [uncultured Modestobacter sp.]|uniref:CaiB/BaiF CoA transferase family protein n=1 Tax=uncultured Modestobacter sp. TaxID=380048 RepID=UPI00262F6694|nr:CoA transferase [uncultured Modestobacter sp.]